MGALSMRLRALTVALALSVSNHAAGQMASVHLQAVHEVEFDCERPWLVKELPGTANFVATINADKSASADLTISGSRFDFTVHFDFRLGVGTQSAPGGSSSLRVIANNHLRAIWDLPNNQVIVDFATTGRTCSSVINVKLKPGKSEYSIFVSDAMWYCSNIRTQSSSCQIK